MVWQMCKIIQEMEVKRKKGNVQQLYLFTDSSALHYWQINCKNF